MRHTHLSSAAVEAARLCEEAYAPIAAQREMVDAILSDDPTALPRYFAKTTGFGDGTSGD